MTGGTGAALFGGGTGAAASQAANQAIGDEYVAPAGLPDWKQPSFDDDDRVDPDKHLEYKPTVRGCITQRSWRKVNYFSYDFNHFEISSLPKLCFRSLSYWLGSI